MPARDVRETTRRVLVCQGSACLRRGGVEARRQWVRAARGRDWAVVPTACLRLCVWSPVTVIYPEGVWLTRMTGERVPEAARAVADGRAVGIPGGVQARAAEAPVE